MSWRSVRATKTHRLVNMLRVSRPSVSQAWSEAVHKGYRSQEVAVSKRKSPVEF